MSKSEEEKTHNEFTFLGIKIKSKKKRKTYNQQESKIQGEYKSFGNLNADKIFYVIKRKSPAGFFSNVKWIIRHIALIEDTDLIPIVDIPLKNTVYVSQEDENCDISYWDKYFLPLNNYSLEEVYKSKNVIIGNNEYPIGPSVDFKEHEMFLKYVKFNKNYFQKFLKFDSIKNKKTLGVHFRGTDMIYCPIHPTPIHPKQIFKQVDEIIEKEKIEQIFFATDNIKYQELFLNYYQHRIPVIIANKNITSYEMLRKEKNYFNDPAIGVLEDFYCFSKCSVVYGSASNIISAARLFCSTPFKLYNVDNGTNGSSIRYNKIRWFLANYLPLKLLNFKNKIDIIEK